MHTQEKQELYEKVLQIDRVSRTVAGGRRLRFRAVVVVGDKKGRVGLGVAKASDTTTSVQKATRQAKKRMITVKLISGTIAQPTSANFGSARVLLKPSAQGNFIVAGGVVRTIAEAAGIQNLSSKMLGTSNKINNAKATLLALEKVS